MAAMIVRPVLLSTLVLALAGAMLSAPAHAQRNNGTGNGNGNGNGGGQPPACSNGGGNASVKNPNCPDVALTIESDLDFGRLVLLASGTGQVWLDLTTGQRHITGGLDEAGGMPVVGRATITGTPMRAVRVEMPASITMTDPTGNQAVLRDFRTSLSAAPMLGSSGQLQFTFTGTLHTASGVAISGRLRGRVPITVSYD